MRNKLLYSLLCAFVITGLVVEPAKSALADSFNANQIIDDGVFDNSSSMSASQIDSFLNSFSNSCISPNSGFRAIDPTGYNPTSGFQYGGYVTAGQVIYDSAQAYGLNPQVLLATLQKEQSLVAGGTNFCNNGDQNKYTAAVGYGCPDSGTTYSYSGLDLYQRNGVTVSSTGSTCVNSAAKAGFSQQVIRGAWLLKFGEQRSEGNVSWAVIKGNWNNSDDPQTCYGGPMTQGTFARCPSGGSAFYDGYTTIDGTAVHMDTGSTAALYWYTPHFSGNQNFFNIFTSWFGSTYFPQPLGGALYYQTSTGKVFLVTDNTRYYIPSWDVMTNYKLDAYPETQASDTTIQGFSDGGTLTNLIWDGSGVYLVNGGTRYHVSSDMCTAWGFACFDNTAVKSLGTTFQTQYLQTGPELTPLMISNGVTYKLVNGRRCPIANPQTLADLGLSTTNFIYATGTNSGEPLGNLLITTPGIVRFPPSSTAYYFDGASYFGVPSPDSYSDWALGSMAQISVPASSYNTTPPPSTSLGSWYVDGSGNKYIIDQGRRILIPSAMLSAWQSVGFTTQPQGLINRLSSVTLNKSVYTDGVYQIYNGKKHHVPNWDAYVALGISDPQTTSLRLDKLQPVPAGSDALGDGIVIAIQGDNQKLYVINNGQTTWIPDPNTFNTFGFNWSNILTYPNTILSDYPLSAAPLASGIANGTYYTVAPGMMYSMSASAATDFGAINSGFQAIGSKTIKNSNIPSLSRFMYNRDSGKIYYASGGAIHYVATYSALVAYGGLRSPMSGIDNSDMALFTVAQTLY